MEGMTRDEFLAHTGKEVDLVHLPNGRTLWVRNMTGLEREQFEQDCTKLGKTNEQYSVRALLTVYCACDGAGTRLFTHDDLSAVSEISANILTPIYEAAVQLNQIGGASIEEHAKNSETVMDDDSPTD